MRCHSNQCQHAHGQQEGPIISHLDPALQQQWDHDANAHPGPIDIKPNNWKKVWWTCDRCPDGHLHHWEAAAANRSNGRGCPQCSSHKLCKHNSPATKAPLVAAQWDYEANDGTPDTVMAQSIRPFAWICGVCGHKWSAPPNWRNSKSRNGCLECSKQARTKKRIKHLTFAEGQDPHCKAILAQWDHERNTPQGNFPHNTTLRSRSSGSAPNAP